MLNRPGAADPTGPASASAAGRRHARSRTRGNLRRLPGLQGYTSGALWFHRRPTHSQHHILPRAVTKTSRGDPSSDRNCLHRAWADVLPPGPSSRQPREGQTWPRREGTPTPAVAPTLRPRPLGAGGRGWPRAGGRSFRAGVPAFLLHPSLSALTSPPPFFSYVGISQKYFHSLETDAINLC